MVVLYVLQVSLFALCRKWLQLYVFSIPSLRTQSRDCAMQLRSLEIAQCSCAYLEIGTQFEDSENALRNLEIAHIPKLRGTYIMDSHITFIIQ